MPVRFKLKNSVVQDKAPLPGDLEIGELALNAHQSSPAAYIKDATGAIRKLAGAGSVTAPDASDTAKGVVELATAAETTTGTDATRAVTPAGLKVELNKKAALASPALTGVPTAPTATDGTSTTQLATTAFVQAAVSTSDEWTRTGTTLAPKTTGDVVAISAGSAAAPSLTPLGDPNTGIYSPGADQWAVSTAGAERVRIDPSGNVGIGTTTPARPFDVNGTIRVSDGAALEFGGISAYISGTSVSNVLLFSTNSIERLRITSSGVVQLTAGSYIEGYLKSNISLLPQLP